MKKNERILSTDGHKIIEIVESSDETYILRRYLLKYDAEEDVNYEVQVNMQGNSIFSEKHQAINEAKRLVKLSW